MDAHPNTLTTSPPNPHTPTQWMVLHLAVANNWGGGDSYRKATLLLEDVLKMYQPNPRAGLRPRRAPDQYVRAVMDGGIV